MTEQTETQALTPANQNPWYVLMTLYGEQTGEVVDEALHAKNRAAWNAWSCQGLSADARAKAAETSGVSADELSGWPARADDIRTLHAGVMRERNQHKTDFAYPGLPDAAKPVDLSFVDFQHRLVLDSATFSGDAVFRSATFSGDAVFRSATFSGDARFRSATFSGEAWFRSATFSGDAWFDAATFSGGARFDSATFSGDAWFGGAVFAGYAYFTVSGGYAPLN